MKYFIVLISFFFFFLFFGPFLFFLFFYLAFFSCVNYDIRFMIGESLVMLVVWDVLPLLVDECQILESFLLCARPRFLELRSFCHLGVCWALSLQDGCLNQTQ